MTIPHIECETMLLRWSETSNGGATITLQLADADDLDAFKSMTLAKGKIAGQRLQAVFVVIGDQEQPVEVKGGELSRLVGKWCRREDFQQWVYEHHGIPQNGALTAECNAETVAATIRLKCQISSRRELDHNAHAAAVFNEQFRKPFMEYIGVIA